MPKRYEVTDASVPGIFTVFCFTALFGALLGLTLGKGFTLLRMKYHGEVSAVSTFNPPPPRLEINEPEDLKAYLLREQKLLNSYGKNSQGYHIPIERAMELLAHE